MEVGLSLLPVLVGLDSPGASREGCGHSHASVTDQKGLLNLACFTYCLGTGALEVSVQLCLGNMGNLQMDWMLGSLSQSWTEPGASPGFTSTSQGVLGG